MSAFRSNSVWPTIGVFLVALVAIPLSRLHFFDLMPGDVGDARLNNYFLENIFQFLIHKSASLWNLGFYTPFPYVLGFSDNLFGAAPVYLLARTITGQPDTAFQVWFVVGYAANFAAADYALRRLGASRPAACLGALIFAFALPTTAHAGHAQLHYRFGIPLATLYFLSFLEQRNIRLLTISALWLTWQFYCGIYMGFFALLLLICIGICFILFNVVGERSVLRGFPREIWSQWSAGGPREKALVVASFALAFGAMILLLFPYLKVASLYGVKREWSEIALMLPRLRSYLLADSSHIWGPLSRSLPYVPMRPEHQMFAGLVPALLAATGLLLVSRSARSRQSALIAGGSILMVVLTLYVGGYSLWYLLHRMPLASAIRALTRIDQVLLFPIAYLAALAVDRLREVTPRTTVLSIGGLIALTIAESASTSMYVSSKKDWRDRLAAIEAEFPQVLPTSGIVFFAQKREPVFAHEIDVMWAALNRNTLTLNGYSGVSPPGYAYVYGTDCKEVVRRAITYLSFAKRAGDVSAYRALVERIIPIGFEGCDPAWFSTPPALSVSAREYTPDEIRRVSYRFDGVAQANGGAVISVTLSNSGDTPISAASSIGKPIRLSWRFLDAEAKPATGWNTRKDLPFDISPKGDLALKIAIEPKQEIKGGTLQLSLVQEGLFWAHDIGVPPLSIKWE